MTESEGAPEVTGAGAWSEGAKRALAVHTTSARPVPKVAAAGQGGAAATVLIYAAHLLGLELPAEVAAALVALASFAAGYLKRG